jgi:hypothetical protein
MDDTGVITLPGIDGTNTITWTNGGNIPAADYGTGPGKQFVIQTSSDLVTWTPVDIGDLGANDDGPAGSLSYTLPTGAGKLFVRLVVTPN